MSLTLADKVKWVATAVTLLGAVLTSIDVYPYNAIFLNFGAFLFLIWGILIKDKAMIIVNSGLLLIYTIGLAFKLL